MDERRFQPQNGKIPRKEGNRSKTIKNGQGQTKRIDKFQELNKPFDKNIQQSEQ